MNFCYGGVCAVTTTNRAEKALALLKENSDSFDLVISDVMMPDMDGFKLLEMIGLTMDLPVISKQFVGGGGVVREREREVILLYISLMLYSQQILGITSKSSGIWAKLMRWLKTPRVAVSASLLDHFV